LQKARRQEFDAVSRTNSHPQHVALARLELKGTGQSLPQRWGTSGWAGHDHPIPSWNGDSARQEPLAEHLLSGQIRFRIAVTEQFHWPVIEVGAERQAGTSWLTWLID